MQDRLYTAVNGFQGLSRFENPGFLTGCGWPCRPRAAR